MRTYQIGAYLCAYTILTIILPALLLHDLLNKGFFLKQTIAEKKSNFFVIPPDIQPRRQENFPEKKEVKRKFRLPGLLVYMEENVVVDNAEVMKAGFEDGHIEEQVPQRFQSCIEEFPIVEC